MELKICKKCSTLFQSYKEDVFCESCRKEWHALLVPCIEYLEKHPEATYNELEEQIGIDPIYIRYYLRQHMIKVQPDFKIKVPCKHCHTPISEGVYCENCEDKIKKILKALQDRKGDEFIGS